MLLLPTLSVGDRIEQRFKDYENDLIIWKRGRVIGPGYNSWTVRVKIDGHKYVSYPARAHVRVVGILDQMAEIK
jgi:hypothetical protein